MPMWAHVIMAEQPTRLAHGRLSVRLKDPVGGYVLGLGLQLLVAQPAGVYHLAPGDLAEHITYADHACALIDEAERVQLRRTHIGVAN
jgi:hypothetical protein